MHPAENHFCESLEIMKFYKEEQDFIEMCVIQNEIRTFESIELIMSTLEDNFNLNSNFRYAVLCAKFCF